MIARASFRDLDFIMRSVNIQSNPSNRGSSLDTNADLRRTQPCLRPFDELQIECDGTLMPCCELRSNYADPSIVHDGGDLDPTTAWLPHGLA